ncbi:MAG: hypothetical protein K9K93_08095 [Acholeplasmataceae bacterium]|nr:hypothetical protein [Acholeplasmataceae bacterium]
MKKQIADIENDPSLIALTTRLGNEEEGLSIDKEVWGELRQNKGRLMTESEQTREGIIRSQEQLSKHQSLMDSKAPSMNDLEEVETRIKHYRKKGAVTYSDLLDTLNRSTVQRENIRKESENKMIKGMSEYNVIYDFFAEASSDHIDQYMIEMSNIEQNNLVQYETDLADLQKKTSDIFKQNFIQDLRHKISEAKIDIDHLNKTLKDKQFGEYKYRIIVRPAKNPEFKAYYQIIMDQNDILDYTLFDDSAKDKQWTTLNQMFHRVLESDEDKQAANLLDYRKYMDVDIEIRTEASTQMLSEVKYTQSGGESQVPYYIIAAASFQQLRVKTRANATHLCIVLFDEAFNNMDSQRVSSMMSYYNELDIQIFLSLTGEKIDSIARHVDTTLVVIRDKERAEVNQFDGEYDD